MNGFTNVGTFGASVTQGCNFPGGVGAQVSANFSVGMSPLSLPLGWYEAIDDEGKYLGMPVHNLNACCVNTPQSVIVCSEEDIGAVYNC